MSRLRALAGHVCLTASGVIIGGIVLFVLRGGVSYLPTLEGGIMPVVQSGEVTDIKRDKIKACFTMPLTKLRSGVPIRFQFFVAAWQDKTWLDRTNVNAVAGTAWMDHEIGKRWNQRYCFELPGTVADSQAIRVSGYAVHRRHLLWLTNSMLPDFTVDALKGSNNPP